MKITLYYEDKLHPTILEVPEEECTVMVETDYRQRLDEAEDKNAVQRRTAQEILDAEVNAPTFRRNRTETRRHIHLSADDLDRRRADAMPDVPTALLGADYSSSRHRAASSSAAGTSAARVLGRRAPVGDCASGGRIGKYHIGADAAHLSAAQEIFARQEKFSMKP